MGTSLNLSALFVDSRRGFSKSFRELLWPEIQLETEDTALNLTSAFQQHVECVYQLCFVGSSVDGDFKVFFSDIKTLGRDKTCVFIKVVDSLPPQAERILNPDSGFNVQVSRDFGAEDKQALMTLLGREIRVREVARRSVDVAEAVELLVKQIDEAAADARRGRRTPLHKLVQGIVDLHVQFDHDLLERYFEELMLATEHSEPVRQVLREVPDAIVAKRLPKLGKSGYAGASSRVFSMLVGRFGEALEPEVVEELAQGSAETEPPPHELTVSAPEVSETISEDSDDEYENSDEASDDVLPPDAPE